MQEFTGPVVLLDPGNFSPQYTANLCSSLAQLGVDVTLITSAPQFGEMPAAHGYRVETFFFRSVTGPGFLRPVTARSPQGRMLLKACAYPFGLARTWRLVRSLRSPGIVHYQWPHVPSLDTGLVSRLRNAGWRAVATAHDFTVPSPFSSLWKRQAMRFYRSADAVVVHTARLAEQAAAELNIRPSRLNVIARGDLGVFRGAQLSRKEARTRVGIDGSGPVLLFFGMIKPNKGLMHLLHAMPEVLRFVPDARLVIVGEPIESFDAYTAVIGQLGIERSVVTRLGYVRDEEVGAYFQSADLAVLPHTDVSLSGVAWVALSFGRPIVGTSVGGLPDLVEEGVNGFLVLPSSAAALSQAIIRAFRDPEQLAGMGAHGAQRFQARYSWAQTAASTLELYRRLMSTHPG